MKIRGLKNFGISALIMLIGTQCFALGFASGETFKATPISGRAQITCEAGTEVRTRTFRCYDNILLPRSYDHFRGPLGFNADQVVLTAKHIDGTLKAKSARYDGALQRTLNRVNLWALTLTQTPLLMEGENLMTYQLYRQGREMTRGYFTVQVERNQSYVCPRMGHYSSNNLDDCDNQYLVCNRLFSENNFCQP